jgi:hypothetical protein
MLFSLVVVVALLRAGTTVIGQHQGMLAAR